MNEQQAKEKIISQVVVTHQDVIIAKSFILANFTPSTDEMRIQFIKYLGVQKPENVVIHQSVDIEPQLSQVADYLRWQLAFVEAVWGLIGEGFLLPQSNSYSGTEYHQGWTTTDIAGSGGYSAGWRFDEYRVTYPANVFKAPSLQGKAPQPLSNSDLFLKNLDIAGLQADIQESLRQAVDCFRHELYLPCVAMLGMASEGAWIELGRTLLKITAKSNILSKINQDKIAEELESPYSSTLLKMETINKLYERKVFLEM
jgi:hypothetical protein